MDSITSSHFLVIEDSNSCRGRPLFLSLLKLFSQKYEQIVILCDEMRENEQLFAEIPVKSKFEFLKVSYNDDILEQVSTGEVKNGTLLAFDSLTFLIIRYGFERTVQILVELSKKRSFDILAVLHQDLLDDYQMNALKKFCQTYIQLECSNSQNLLTLFSNSKKPETKSYSFEIENFNLILKPISDKIIKNQASNTQPDVEKLASFNLSLSAKELEAKRRLALPFTNVRKLEDSQNGGQIIYYAEKEDDIDEEDPDDDLDI